VAHKNMQKKTIIITTTLIILVAYYFYWQNQNKLSANSQQKENSLSSQISELRTQVNYYKELYQKRVNHDLRVKPEQATQTDLSFEQMSLFSEISQGVLN